MNAERFAPRTYRRLAHAAQLGEALVGKAGAFPAPQCRRIEPLQGTARDLLLRCDQVLDRR